MAVEGESLIGSLDWREVEKEKIPAYAGRDVEKVVSVDLGEIYAITLTDGEEAVVISGRQIRSVKRYRNKSIGKIQ